MRPTRFAVLLSTVIALSFATAPAASQAAGYDVHVCETSWSPPANNAFVSQADGGMTAYAVCPAGDGLVVRNVYDGGNTASGSGAYLIFDTPAGTSLGSMDFDAGVERHDCGYSALIVAGGHDFGGNVIWGVQAGQDCDSWQAQGAGAFFGIRFTLPVNADRVRLQVRCANGSTCNRKGIAALRLKNVVLHVVDNTGPGLSGGRGGLWTSGDAWISGKQSLGFDASDGSGIKDLSIQVDGREISHRTSACDYTRPAPCPAATSADEMLSTSGFGGDGDHRITVAAADAASNISAASKIVHVDNTAPDPPAGLAVDDGDGWRRTN